MIIACTGVSSEGANDYYNAIIRTTIIFICFEYMTAVMKKNDRKLNLFSVFSSLLPSCNKNFTWWAINLLCLSNDERWMSENNRTQIHRNQLPPSTPLTSIIKTVLRPRIEILLEHVRTNYSSLCFAFICGHDIGEYVQHVEIIRETIISTDSWLLNEHVRLWK